MIRLAMGSMTLNNTVSSDFLIFSIKRERLIYKALKGIKLEHRADAANVHMVSYEEQVINKLTGTRTEDLEAALSYVLTFPVDDIAMHFQVNASDGDAFLLILPDLLVEYWEEYVEYGYLAWFTGMG